MEDINKSKILRVLAIYTKLIQGEVVNKADEARNYNVNERSIQRDIEDIRNYMDTQMESTGVINSVIYDRKLNGYKLEQEYKTKLSNSEALAICKILLDSRAFTKDEMQQMLNKIIECCIPQNDRKQIQDLIRNEEYHYIELQHKTVFIDKMWEIGQAIQQCKYIEIDYLRLKDKAVVKRKVKPVAIMFSEYYFYVTAFIEDKELKEHFDVINDSFPTIYRIDRIKNLKVLEERFHIPYKDRFEEGEFRKRVQFMYGGKLQRVRFKYKGESLEAVLDKLPTAKVIDEEEDGFVVEAEVFGSGIDMWLRSQGDKIELR